MELDNIKIYDLAKTVHETDKAMKSRVNKEKKTEKRIYQTTTFGKVECILNEDNIVVACTLLDGDLPDYVYNLRWHYIMTLIVKNHSLNPLQDKLRDYRNII